MFIKHRLIAAILVLALATDWVLGQEVCHWECEVYECDYYADYCDYDCYEVCYPYARGSAATSAQRRLKYFAPSSSTKGGRVATNPKTRDNHPGKVVRMKLANPSFQTIKDGQIISTRGSPPRGFALFSDCLSTRGNPVAP